VWELTKSFRFEAAHSLVGTALGAAGEEIHGHSFRAEVSVRGVPDPGSGMLIDLVVFDSALEEVRRTLDHKFLNRVEGLERPTLEHIARYIFERVQQLGSVTRVTVYRDACGEACTYFPREEV
jgi:6-pyruvoyltetrahydropterin/6-carboxytetrahydropterin synthase